MDDLWSWVGQSINDFRMRADRERFDMATLFLDAVSSMENDPEQSLLMFEKAQAKAEQLNERWWLMLCRHWICQTLLHRTRDIDAAFQIAGNAVEEVENQMLFRVFPQRVCLRDDLVSAYQLRDPLGYDTEIKQGCEFIGETGRALTGCQHCKNLLEIDRLILHNKLQDATELALTGLKSSTTEDMSHYTPQYYAQLSRISVLQKDWDRLLHWSQSGELYYQNMGSDLSNIELIMWNAVALRHLSQSENAMEKYKKARHIARVTKYRMTIGYYDALTEYHKAGDNPRLILISLGLEFNHLKGASFIECVRRLERLRIMKSLGIDTADEVSRIMSAAENLRDPATILSQMHAIIDGCDHNNA